MKYLPVESRLEMGPGRRLHCGRRLEQIQGRHRRRRGSGAGPVAVVVVGTSFAVAVVCGSVAVGVVQLVVACCTWRGG